MKDSHEILNEFEYLKKELKDKSRKKSIDGIKAFFSSINSLCSNIELIDSSKDEYLNQIINNCNNLIREIKKMNSQNNNIFEPFSKINDEQKNTLSKLSSEYDKIKNFTEQGKKKSEKSKKEDSKNEDSKKEEYNKNLNDLKEGIQHLQSQKESAYKKAILNFAKNIGFLGKKFIEFEKLINGIFNEKNSNKNNNEEKENNNNNNNINNNNNNNRINEEEEEMEEEEGIEKQKSEEKEKQEIHETQDITENEDYEKLFYEIVNKLPREEDIEENKKIKLNNILQKDQNSYNTQNYNLMFLKIIKNYFPNHFIPLKNKNNFEFIANVINQIKIVGNDIPLLNKIIELSHRIRYDKKPLCSLINQSKQKFSKVDFWETLIETNLITSIKKFITNENIQLAKSKSNKTDNIIHNEEKEKERNLDSILNKINGYQGLKDKLKEQIRAQAKIIGLHLISNIIVHMCNYKFDGDDILAFAMNFSIILGLHTDECAYFRKLLSIYERSKDATKRVHEKEREKRGFILNKLDIKVYQTAKFLPKEDFPKLLSLNKTISKHIRIDLIRFRLNQKDISLNERIKIWEMLLKVNELKIKYNYQNYKNNIQNQEHQNNNKSIIDLDLIRTPFFRDDEKHRNITSILLKCINEAIKDDQFEYYQGMNFIICFIYQLLDYDEERAFYLFLGIIKNTQYNTILGKGFQKLALYFDIYDNLLEKFYPELFYTLHEKKIISQSYCTQWFITLFTSEIKEIEKGKASKLLLFIWDYFITGGLSVLINSGLIILEYHKNIISSLSGNDLIKYMVNKLNDINDIPDEDFEQLKKSFIRNYEILNENNINKYFDILKFNTKNKIKNI